jgi:hypothetical protein
MGLDRVAHSRLGRLMHGSIELAGREKSAHRLAFDDVGLFEPETRSRQQPAKPRLLQPDVISAVRIVDADDFVNAFVQSVRRCGSDETCCAGYKDFYLELFLPFPINALSRYLPERLESPVIRDRRVNTRLAIAYLRLHHYACIWRPGYLVRSKMSSLSSKTGGHHRTKPVQE